MGLQRFVDKFTVDPEATEIVGEALLAAIDDHKATYETAGMALAAAAVVMPSVSLPAASSGGHGDFCRCWHCDRCDVG